METKSITRRDILKSTGVLVVGFSFFGGAAKMLAQGSGLSVDGMDPTVLDSWLAISKDGGRSFKPSRPIFDVAAPYFGGASGIPGVARCMGFPQVGIDPKLGRLYVTWSAFRNGDGAATRRPRAGVVQR